MAPPLFHVVMHEPEIPNNTGNIGRTCIATGCVLHLVRPLGFDTSEKGLRRAGLDYWPRLRVHEHDGWAACVAGLAREWSALPARAGARPPCLWLTSGKRGVPAWSADLRAGDALVFGKETAGLPEEILERHAGRVVMLPMIPHERGLNVATVVCGVVYEGIRQCVGRGEAAIDAHGRLVVQ